jgi:heat shock protein HslJ
MLNSMCAPYELKGGNRIAISQIWAILIACEDMTLERTFFEVLGKVDNYSVTDTTLTLNKARMAIGQVCCRRK